MSARPFASPMETRLPGERAYTDFTAEKIEDKWPVY